MDGPPITDSPGPGALLASFASLCEHERGEGLLSFSPAIYFKNERNFICHGRPTGPDFSDSKQPNDHGLLWSTRYAIWRSPLLHVRQEGHEEPVPDPEEDDEVSPHGLWLGRSSSHVCQLCSSYDGYVFTKKILFFSLCLHYSPLSFFFLLLLFLFLFQRSSDDGSSHDGPSHDGSSHVSSLRLNGSPPSNQGGLFISNWK